MNFTKNLSNIQNRVYDLLDKYKAIVPIIEKISQKKGSSYLVGGAVRDLLLDIDISDIDIEVHNLNFEDLSNLLSEFGTVNYVGKSFGVLKVGNIPIDWSLPRRDSSGRKPDVKIDPDLTIEEALKRRDLTINAMAIDLKNISLIDPFGGFNDLQNKILRSPDNNFFVQDPLRFYRVMQFIPRFGMYPSDDLNQVCKTMDISNISIERIEYEFEKMLLKSVKPSLGFLWLKDIGRIKEILPELADTIKTKQEIEWHPEIYVFTHLMQSLDAAAKFDYKDDNEKLIMMYAALCHDLGKATTTRFIDGRLRSLGHEKAGISLTKRMLKRITKKVDLISQVAALVGFHMVPLSYIRCDAKKSTYKKFALKLKKYDLNIFMVSKLCLADKQGRNGKSSEPLDITFKDLDQFIQNASDAGVLYSYVEPLLLGRDLKNLVEPGPRMGEILKYAYKIQLDKDISDKELLKQKVIKKFNLK